MSTHVLDDQLIVYLVMFDIVLPAHVNKHIQLAFSQNEYKILAFGVDVTLPNGYISSVPLPRI